MPSALDYNDTFADMRRDIQDPFLAGSACQQGRAERLLTLSNSSDQALGHDAPTVNNVYT